MHCFLKSLIVICRYHHFTYRAANHCCQSLIPYPIRLQHFRHTFLLHIQNVAMSYKTDEDCLVSINSHGHQILLNLTCLIRSSQALRLDS